jgi:hypothetical protein
MIRLLFLLYILSIFTSCSTIEEEHDDVILSRETETFSDSEITFNDYLNAIPTVQLPIKMRCEAPLTGSKLGFKDHIIEKYGQANSGIHGVLAQTDNFIAILYLYPADVSLPIIQTTDRQGNKISELNLYERYCGEDEFYLGYSWAEISKNLTITLSDSSLVFERDEAVEIIEHSKRIEQVRHRKYFIDERGEIKPMK